MRTLYHAAPRRLRRKILREGLAPKRLSPNAVRITGLTHGVYLDTSFDEAVAWGGTLSLRDIPEGAEAYSTKYDVFKITLPDEVPLVPDPESFDIGQARSAFITRAHIPAKSITYIDTVESEWS